MNDHSSGSTSDLITKICVLGDANTGKSSFVKNLLEIAKNKEDSGKKSDPTATHGKETKTAATHLDEELFQSFKFPSSDLIEAKNITLLIQMWEYNDLNKEQTEVLLSDALVCVILFDLTRPETANSAFNHWLVLKEKLMPEAFLFMIGTHVENFSTRKVDAKDVCKASAQNDAMYVEIGNEDGTNYDLFWQLLSQRLNSMLSIRETLLQEVLNDTHFNVHNPHELMADLHTHEVEKDPALMYELRAKRRKDKFEKLKEADILDTKFLNSDIIDHSVGSILSSSLGIEFWPGYESEESALREIGKEITEHVRNLSLDPSNAASAPLEFTLSHIASYNREIVERDGDNSSMMVDVHTLEQIFALMGFKMPPSFLQTQQAVPGIAQGTIGTSEGGGVSNSGATSAGKAASATKGKGSVSPRGNVQAGIKVNVHLPDGSSTDMKIHPGYNIGRQVDAFLLRHDMENDDDAREKLNKIGQKIAEKHARDKT